MTATPPAVLDRFTAPVQIEMRHVFNGRVDPFYQMARYHLGWVDQHGVAAAGDGGKGLRSTLCLLSTEAVGGSVERVLPAAAALELVHNFSLVHDDVQDDSVSRRHRPTVWSLWGKPQAINVGDSLFSLARLALLRLSANAVPSRHVVHLAVRLDETCLRLCEGQYLDMEFQARPHVTLEQYVEMIDGKTAALMACACYFGAFLGGYEPAVAGQFHEIGRDLGLAFQIKDDVLGVWGASETTGKPVADDILSRKKTFPAVYASTKADPGVRTQLAEIYARPQMAQRDVAQVLELFDEAGARAAAEAAARR
ncbi:MAG: polyprenyl synthetase family protein, partial [Chloroflexota bacterium]